MGATILLVPLMEISTTFRVGGDSFSWKRLKMYSASKRLSRGRFVVFDMGIISSFGMKGCLILVFLLRLCITLSRSKNGLIASFLEERVFIQVQNTTRSKIKQRTKAKSKKNVFY